MRYFYILREALRICLRFRLRTLLVAASASVGVAGVISSVNYADAGRQEVLAQLRRSGTSVITIRPRQNEAVAGRPKTGDIVRTLRPEDERALRLGVPEIYRISEVASGQFLFKAGDLSKPLCPVIGCEPSYFTIRDWPVERGRIFDEREFRTLARVVVLGHEIAQTMFPDRDPVGELVAINRVPVRVVGVLTERGQGLDAVDEDAQIYVPASTALTRLMNRTYLNTIEAKVSSDVELDSAVRRVEVVMRRRHRPRAGMPVDYVVQTQQKTVETLNLSSKRLGTLVRAVGFAGLLVSAFGVFGLCWIAIRNRSREFGVRRAIGATSFDILFQVIFETLAATAIGVVAGLVAGKVVASWAEYNARLPIEFNWNGALIVVVVALLLNLAFSLLSAAHAARIDPSEALQFE